MAKEKIKFNEHYKALLLERDFEYFLKNDIELGDYNKTDIDTIYSSYHSQQIVLKQRLKENKKQFLNYLNGQVILMFDGGFLTALFRLDGTTHQHNLIDFKGLGENWAYFELWKKYERKKRFRKNIWNNLTKIGAVLAIILTIVKILELFGVINIK